MKGKEREELLQRIQPWADIYSSVWPLITVWWFQKLEDGKQPVNRGRPFPTIFLLLCQVLDLKEKRIWINYCIFYNGPLSSLITSSLCSYRTMFSLIGFYSWLCGGWALAISCLLYKLFSYSLFFCQPQKQALTHIQRVSRVQNTLESLINMTDCKIKGALH